MLCSFSEASQGLVSIVGSKLTIGLEEWRGLALVGNGLSGLSPTGTLLVHSRREKYGVVLTSVY